jgi:arabinose-5-phosphate isomerase
MPDVFHEMSSKRLGMTCVVDEGLQLLGIITDGDLRRHMRPDLLDARVEAVMTAGPKTLRRDHLASEALELFNSGKITAALVVEAGKPIGIVHLHDLLRAGIA